MEARLEGVHHRKRGSKRCRGVMHGRRSVAPPLTLGGIPQPLTGRKLRKAGAVQHVWLVGQVNLLPEAAGRREAVHVRMRVRVERGARGGWMGAGGRFGWVGQGARHLCCRAASLQAGASGSWARSQRASQPEPTHLQAALVGGDEDSVVGDALRQPQVAARALHIPGFAGI